MPLTTKWATRWARVLVLPDPAPAITSRGPASARCGRIPRCSATAAPCELFRQPDFPQSTRPRDRRQRSNRYRLRPAAGWPGSPATHFVAAAGPPAMLGWYKARRHGLAFSVGMTPAKNMRAVLRDSSLQQLIVWGGISRPGRPRLMDAAHWSAVQLLRATRCIF